MKTKGIIEEDFVNYKLPSMFINTCYCDFKCCLERGLESGECQNASLRNAPERDIPDEVIFSHYANNPITKAVVIGGMEPMLQIDEIINLIKLFREYGDHSEFVIYTGYYPAEIYESIIRLQEWDNIIIKFGRYIPGQENIYDDVLGVSLVSSNQFARKIS